MNGYGYQTYGELRYMHTLISIPASPDRDKQTVFDSAAIMVIGDVPRIKIDYASAGELPEVSDLVEHEGINLTSVTGQGIPELLEGIFTPTAPENSDEVTEWTTDGDIEYDYTPGDNGYYVEVRDSDFVLLAELADFLDGSVKMELGKPSEINIELAGTDAAITYITKDNFLVVRNAREVIIDQFIIQKIDKVRDGDAIYLHVSGQSQAVLLEREAIVEYSTPVDETQAEDGTPVYNYTYLTVAEVLQDLLDFQAVERITIADIDTEIAERNVIWSCADVSILGGITELQKHLPLSMRGHIWVDYEGGLHWIKQPLDVVAETFRVGEHITDNSYSVDYSNLITRVIMRGWQQIDGTRVALEDPGYIDRNVETYGVYSVSKTDNRIKYPDSLVDFANRILDEYAEPRVVFDAEIINGRIGAKDARDITLGTQYQIVDEPQEIDVTVTVYGIEYNLSDPLDVRLTISNRNENLADMFGDIYSQINEDPPDYTNPDTTRPTIKDIFDDLIENPTEPYNEDLIDTIGDAIGATTGGARLAKIESLHENGDDINVYFWDFDAEVPGWEEDTSVVRKPYMLQPGIFTDGSFELADGRTVTYDISSGLDETYQRRATCTDSGQEFDVVEELQPPYAIDELLLVRKDAVGRDMDMNFLGRTYVISLESIIDEVVDEIEETSGTLPDPTDGSETTDTSYIPLVMRAKIIEANSDGNRLSVYMYNFTTDSWGVASRLVYKPYILQYGGFVGVTLEYLDGTSVTYDTSSLDKTYQRRATWEDSEEVEWTEVQEITPPYFEGEVIEVMMDKDGAIYDINTAGRTWAAVTEAEEVV
jgi:hypothetical protein